MKADRERDALIAEKVMGLDLSQECDGEQGEYYDGWMCFKCHKTGSWGEDFEHTIMCPHYSTRIADAWQVVENLWGIDTKIEIESPDNRAGANWQVRIIEYGIDELEGADYYHAVADTAELAICLAALKAVGYEYEEQEYNGEGIA